MWTLANLALNSFSESVCIGTQVWHSAHDRLVSVGFDLLIALFNDTKGQMQSMHLIHPEVSYFSQFPISHCFSELLVFGLDLAPGLNLVHLN